MKYSNRRTWLGAFFFLVFVGEPTVGFRSGLFTNPAGLLALVGLYTVLFLLYEALVQRFKLTNGRLILLTFGIYSVVVTGFLHGEIGDYGLQPQNWLVTTMIRIQCSLFPLFAYYCLNKIYKRDPARVMSVRTALIVAGVFVLLLTPTRMFGLTRVFDTFRDAPVAALLYAVLGVVAILIALKPTKQGSVYRTKALTIWTWLLFAVAIVPAVPFFFVLLVAMPVVTAVYCRVAAWRNAPV